jgi:hypothetical protein
MNFRLWDFIIRFGFLITTIFCVIFNKEIMVLYMIFIILWYDGFKK